MKNKIRDIYENGVVLLLWCLCYLFGILPRCVRYGVFTPFVSFIMRSVAHYRYDVIMRQLRESFPQKSEEELQDICNRYYDHLAEMIVGTLSLAAMNDKKRSRATELNLTDDFYPTIDGRNVVVLTSHYGFWEIALNLYLYMLNTRNLLIYALNLIICLLHIKARDTDKWQTNKVLNIIIINFAAQKLSKWL